MALTGFSIPTTLTDDAGNALKDTTVTALGVGFRGPPGEAVRRALSSAEGGRDGSRSGRSRRKRRGSLECHEGSQERRDADTFEAELRLLPPLDVSDGLLAALVGAR